MSNTYLGRAMRLKWSERFAALTAGNVHSGRVVNETRPKRERAVNGCVEERLLKMDYYTQI